VTNVEADHLDHYSGIEEIEAARGNGPHPQAGEGADGRPPGAASRDAAVAVHSGHGGVAAHPDDEVVVALSAGVEIGFGPGVSAVISSSISLTSSSKFEDCPRSDGAACAAGAARSSPLSTRAAASRVILFIG